MKTLCVLQHVEAEYLGLIEDHLEGRSVRFQYSRPFTAGGTVPPNAEGFGGLIILGAGPLGIVSGHLIPSLAPELRLTADFLKRGLPVIGIGVGACILCVAAGGGADEAPLRFEVDVAKCTTADALGGHLPAAFPMATYMRDRPVLPANANILAQSAAGGPLVFQLRANCIGFLGHPGVKSGMIEDLVMEFDESPDDIADGLAALRAAQGDIAAALTEIMVGLIEVMDVMAPPLHW